MNTMTRWDPFRELEEMHNRLNRYVGHGRLPETGHEEAMTMAEWAPLVDICEDEKEYSITADIPEVRKEDVKVTVDQGVLNIQGERKTEREQKGRAYHRVERAYGKFARAFALPDEVDGTKVNAEFKDGVLTVHLPKTEKALPKSVEIKVS